MNVVDPEGVAHASDVVAGMGLVSVNGTDVSGMRPKETRALLDAAISAKGFGPRRPLEVVFAVPSWMIEEEAEEEEEGPHEEEEHEEEEEHGEEEKEDLPLPPASDCITVRFTRAPSGFRFRGDSLAQYQLTTETHHGGAFNPLYCRCIVSEVLPYSQAFSSVPVGSGISHLCGFDVRSWSVEDLQVNVRRWGKGRVVLLVCGINLSRRSPFLLSAAASLGKYVQDHDCL